MSVTLNQLEKELSRLANPAKAKVLQRFFKTGPGEYAQGDIFLGLVVPQIRSLVKKYPQLSLTDIRTLLRSTIHEKRLLALLLLVDQFHQADGSGQKAIFDLYLENTKHINNWDLVDLSAEHIVGAYLAQTSRAILPKLAKSASLWERRIAILSTFHYIKKGESSETLKIATLLLNDRHDLIHKAVGWMLREVGKRCSQQAEENFLKQHYQRMPRTMLRYAIERFPEKLRKQYLKNLI